MDETVKTPIRPTLSPKAAYYLRIIGTLFVITAVVSILLALVNHLTRPIIDRLAEEKRQAAMAAVLPGEDLSYSPLNITGEGVSDANGVFQGGDLLGYCVQSSANGFGGAIRLMVGIDPNGAVTGVVILSHSETAGLGARAQTDPAFAQQYVGRSGVIGVAPSAADSDHIQAISGATVTSRAVTEAVNRALAAVDAYMKGGAQG